MDQACQVPFGTSVIMSDGFLRALSRQIYRFINQPNSSW
jgi:hypothetical protein